MNLLRSIPLRSYTLAFFSGLLQIFIFPTSGPIHPLRAAVGWFALVPLLLALLRPDRDQHRLKPAQGAVIGYLSGVTWYVGNCFWIYQTMYLYGGLQKPLSLVILLLFSLYLGLYHAFFATLVVLLGRLSRRSAVPLLAAPFLWVAIELARARITGFPWDLLGNSQVENIALTSLAPIAGVMSISFVLAASNAAFASFLVLTGRKRIWFAAATAAFAVGMSLAGLKNSNVKIDPAHAHPYAVMLQENLAVGAAGREVRPLSPGDELEAFTQATLQPGIYSSSQLDLSAWRLPRGVTPAMLIWPEAPSHLRSDDPQFRDSIGLLVRAAHAPAIVGSLGVDFSNRSPRGFFEYDSATLFDKTGKYQGRYDKIHLVPWGEYVPFKRFFSFAEKLTEGVGDMDPGTERTLFAADGHRYGIFICYESIFGDEVREFVRNGAEVLVNISDDGWYGDTGAPWQHLNMARMRAIENNRWVLRATNTGVTTAIDPQGHIHSEAPRHIRAAFAFPFDFVQGTTFYTRHGDWFAWLCAAASLCLFGTSIPRGKSSNAHAEQLAPGRSEM